MMNQTLTATFVTPLPAALSSAARPLLLPGALATVLAVTFAYHQLLNPGNDRPREDLDAGRVPAAIARYTPADLERRDGTGATLLHRAALLGNEPAVDALLARGADPNAPDNTNATPLMDAAHTGHPRIVAALLARGASVHPRTTTGASALTCAVVGGDPSCLRQLLAAGADPNAPGLTYPPLALVTATGDRADLARILLDAGADPNARARDGSTVLQIVSKDHAPACTQTLRHAGAR